MDNENEERSHFMTPLLTPCVSDARTTQYEQHMDDLNRNLESLNFNYPSTNNIDDYESETESDVQDQQPTEATDDSNHPNQLQKYPDATTIDIPFNPQPSHDRDDICSPSNETDSSNESFSAVVPDLDSICVTKPIDPSNLVYRESLCEPLIDEQDEISIFKQTLTTTTTLTTECIELKKDKNNPEHIMISYNHSTKSLCTKIAKALKSLNYIVWIDQENISGDVLTSMASAVENSFVVLMAVNEQYYQSRYCRLEAEYAMERNKASIPMLMQSGYKAAGWLGLINGSKFQVDFNKHQFDDAFHLLIREIEAVRISLGIDGYDKMNISASTQSITTMNSSWNYHRNPHDWNADDVLEWLNREKLEIFQTVLTGFTGATLWQLYKIKFDSAPDFYRTIEQLLLPTVPLRLLHNLTFIAALESLFSSSVK